MTVNGGACLGWRIQEQQWDGWCERGELNPHGCPLDPKSSASANSATLACSANSKPRFSRGLLSNLGWIVGIEPTYERVTVVCVNRFTIATISQMARLRGFEPLTYGLEVRCSIQLSYRRKALQLLCVKDACAPFASPLTPDSCALKLSFSKSFRIRGF